MAIIIIITNVVSGDVVSLAVVASGGRGVRARARARAGTLFPQLRGGRRSLRRSTRARSMLNGRARPQRCRISGRRRRALPSSRRRRRPAACPRNTIQYARATLHPRRRLTVYI